LLLGDCSINLSLLTFDRGCVKQIARVSFRTLEMSSSWTSLYGSIKQMAIISFSMLKSSTFRPLNYRMIFHNQKGMVYRIKTLSLNLHTTHSLITALNTLLSTKRMTVLGLEKSHHTTKTFIFINISTQRKIPCRKNLYLLRFKKTFGASTFGL